MNNPFHFEDEAFLDSEYNDFLEALEREMSGELPEDEMEEERARMRFRPSGNRRPARRSAMRSSGVRAAAFRRPSRPLPRRPRRPRLPKRRKPEIWTSALVRPVYPLPYPYPPEPPDAEPRNGDDGGRSAISAIAESSARIGWAQEALNQLRGLQLVVDGTLNVETRSALRAFQQQQGLPADGTVTAATARALVAAGAPPFALTESVPESVPESVEAAEFDAFEFYDGEDADFALEDEVSRSSRAYIQWAQRALNRILGLRLAVDGVSGAQTRSAIRSFQQRQGLTADGIIGSITERALIATGAGQPPQSFLPQSSLPQSSLPTPGYTPSPPSGSPTVAPDIVSVRGIQVARQIAPQLEALLAAAQAAGVPLSGSGYRSMQRQIELRRQNCGATPYDIYEKPSSQCTPPTAIPGRSQHERGLAIDFTYQGSSIKSRNSAAFRWLAENAARYGLYNLPSEPWHWSVDGR